MIVVGGKASASLRDSMEVSKVFEDVDRQGNYEIAMQVKDYLIQEVMANRIGKVIAVYPWPKNLNLIKPRVVKLLPCDELLSKQAELVDTIERIIQESDSVSIIGYLANIWLPSRLYELLFDTAIAAAGAQSQQLETSSSKMKKEKIVVRGRFLKAKKGAIDNSLREVFSAKIMMDKKGGRR